LPVEYRISRAIEAGQTRHHRDVATMDEYFVARLSHFASPAAPSGHDARAAARHRTP
jgi:hypothetical protein